MKNLFSTVCVLSIFLLITLSCSSSGTKNYDSKLDTSTSRNYPGITTTDYASNTVPVVEPTIDKAKSLFKAALVIAENAELRKSPSQNGEVIDSLSEDASIEVIKQKGAWFLVRTESGQEGWMHGNTIRYSDRTQSGDLTVSRDLKVEPETNTEYVIPEYVSPIPEKTVVIETRRAETLETPAPVYRTTPEPTYSQRDETPTVQSSTPTARCADGTYSYSANRQGTCSWHGGVAEWLDSSPSAIPSYTTPRRSTSDTEYRPKTVNVRGYTRKDGTYVAPHTRSAPRRRN